VARVVCSSKFFSLPEQNKCAFGGSGHEGKSSEIISALQPFAKHTGKMYFLKA